MAFTINKSQATRESSRWRGRHRQHARRVRSPYIELHACSAFSFLRGGSFPEQLAETAAELEMPALALLDCNGVYGAQRFSVAARETNIRPIIGCELSMESGGVLPL